MTRLTASSALALAAIPVVSAGVAVAIYYLFRRRVTPVERERRRRVAVNAAGRMTDGNITDASGHELHYSYEIHGVTYMASQDVTGLVELGDYGPASLIGPVTVKYWPGRPANSIVMCETWSGLRAVRRAPAGNILGGMDV